MAKYLKVFLHNNQIGYLRAEYAVEFAAQTDMGQVQLCDAVIDTRTQNIIKLRYPIETILDAYLLDKPDSDSDN